MKQQIAMVLLMGGKSSRMGQSKALLIYQDMPFWQRIVQEMTVCGPVYLSVNDKDPVPSQDYPILIDEYTGIGPLGGIVTALRNIPQDYVFICACDMPKMDRYLIKYLCDQITEEWDGVMIQDDKGHYDCAAGIYSKNMLPVIDKMLQEGNYRLQDLLKKTRIRSISVRQLPVSREVLCNVNTPKEYEAIKKEG
ncbi:MAG: molybdenum cofactor guanylyltransferase [Cellulosilyticaceae bacterium]